MYDKIDDREARVVRLGELFLNTLTKRVKDPNCDAATLAVACRYLKLSGINLDPGKPATRSAAAKALLDQVLEFEKTLPPMGDE